MKFKHYLIPTLIVTVGIFTLLTALFYAPTNHVSAEHGHEATHATTGTTDCSHLTGIAHVATIKNNVITPNTIHAHLCDTLTITNDDNNSREMAFGEHEHHTSYNGFGEQIVKKGQSVHVTLNQAGTFTFHDHLDEAAQATLVVTDDHHVTH